MTGWKNLIEDLTDEVEDFWEDFLEHATGKKAKKIHKKKEVMLYGTAVLVRPAYIFAERIDNLLKIIFGASVMISAIVSSIWGFTGLSDLLDFLIHSLVGRTILFLIGTSYLILGIWKFFHLHKE